jgi:hypothetical protein
MGEKIRKTLRLILIGNDILTFIVTIPSQEIKSFKTGDFHGYSPLKSKINRNTV